MRRFLCLILIAAILFAAPVDILAATKAVKSTTVENTEKIPSIKAGTTTISVGPSSEYSDISIWNRVKFTPSKTGTYLIKFSELKSKKLKCGAARFSIQMYKDKFYSESLYGATNGSFRLLETEEYTKACAKHYKGRDDIGSLILSDLQVLEQVDYYEDFTVILNLKKDATIYLCTQSPTEIDVNFNDSYSPKPYAYTVKIKKL